MGDSQVQSIPYRALSQTPVFSSFQATTGMRRRSHVMDWMTLYKTWRITHRTIHPHLAPWTPMTCLWPLATHSGTGVLYSIQRTCSILLASTGPGCVETPILNLTVHGQSGTSTRNARKPWVFSLRNYIGFRVDHRQSHLDDTTPVAANRSWKGKRATYSIRFRKKQLRNPWITMPMQTRIITHKRWVSCIYLRLHWLYSQPETSW